jgi:hypothetical protein
MNPGIQLMLRMEREAEAQRRPYMVYTDDLEAEKLLHPARQDNLIKRIFRSRRQQQSRQQQCECA